MSAGGPPGRVLGVDLSSYQVIADPRVWLREAQAAGVRFVYLKASQGTGLRSKVCRARLEAARALGLHVGPYHFAEVGQDAYPQVQLLLEVAGPWLPGDLPPALDLESAPEGMAGPAIEAWALRWLAAAEQTCGRRPILYHGPRFWRERHHAPQLLAGEGYEVWRAEYHNEHTPRLPREGEGPKAWDLWPAWRIWQWTGKGRLPFYGADLDLNVWAGTEAELDAWCR